MATVKQYVQQMRDTQDSIAAKYGSDISHADKQTRVLNLSILALLAVLIKTLVDKGVIANADLTATLNAAGVDTYPDEPLEPPAPPAGP
jgi:hypothetical protein